ncbi:MAG: hypothetical protein ABI743_08930 [bacterium]
MLMRTLIVLWLALALTACGGTHSVVGTWISEAATPGGKTTAEFTFNPDLTMLTVIAAPGFGMSVPGTYAIKGNEITMVSKSSETVFAGHDPGVAVVQATIKGAPDITQVGTLRFKSADEFIVTVKDQAQTFRRKK